MAADGSAFPSLVEIESSTGRTDRLTVAALRPRALAVEIFKPRNTINPDAHARVRQRGYRTR